MFEYTAFEPRFELMFEYARQDNNECEPVFEHMQAWKTKSQNPKGHNEFSCGNVGRLWLQ